MSASSDPDGNDPWQEEVKHEHVRLLNQLRALHVVPAEQRDGLGTLREVGDGQRLEGEVAGELLVAMVARVVAVDECRCEPPPAGRFGVARLLEGGGVEQVPARHGVRERVVVDVLVVLVGADHPVDMRGPLGVDAYPRRPIACRLTQQLAAGGEHLAVATPGLGSAPSPRRRRR